MDKNLLTIVETVDNLKKDIENVIEKQKLSAKYRYFIEYYIELCNNVMRTIQKLADRRTITSLKELNRFRKTHLDTLLQLHAHLMMKSQHRSDNVSKKESAFEFIADDIFIKLKCYGYNALILITEQSDFPEKMQMVPFALEKTENFRAVIILVNKKIVGDITQWNLIGHEIGHIVPETREIDKDQKEFCADFFATMIFGPSYLCSMIENVKGKSLTTAYIDHPPWLYRIEGSIEILKTSPKKVSKNASKIYKNWSEDLISSIEKLTKNVKNDLDPRLKIEIERSYSKSLWLIGKYQKNKNLGVLNMSDSIIKSLKSSKKRASLIQKLTPIEIIQLYCLGHSTNIYKFPYKFTVKAIYQWGINQI